MNKENCAILLTIIFSVINITTSNYNYEHVLHLSLLFYEAQRSGHLPPDNRIPWRGDSALHDRGIKGEDLTGGYYDAGDFVKFGFTMASTTTLLAWGCLVYKQAYIHAGEWKNMLSALQWASDYFIKCHVSEFEFYGQVGDFNIDHLFWGRPEDMNMSRPAYKIDAQHPGQCPHGFAGNNYRKRLSNFVNAGGDIFLLLGSDLAGETAAALAAISLVFKEVDPEYSALCLLHAKQLYKFASQYRGLYHESIKGAAQFYESTDYGDELTWAAAWLYKVTNNIQYIEEAGHHYANFRLRERPNEFFYNKKVAGVQVLLAQLTGQTEYVEAVKSFCDFSVHKQTRTAKGLIYIEKFGTLCHAANIAFLCLQAAEMNVSSSKEYINFAKSQIDYMLGDSGRSYVVGFGHNYPKQPYHAASSCQKRPAPCSWEAFHKNASNPQLLLGALVSGPDENDFYFDKRDEYTYSEVTLDYNAGFQSTVAGLRYLELKGLN